MPVPPVPRTDWFRYVYDDVFIDDGILDVETHNVCPAGLPTNQEVNYVYLKGKGWVPETPQVNALIAKEKREKEAAERRAADEEYVRRLREQQRNMNFGYPGGMAQLRVDGWVNQRMTWAQEYRQAQLDEAERRLLSRQLEPITYNWHTPNLQQIPRTPRERTPEELTERGATRYFPGGGVAPEPTRAETLQERRVREYQEARERWRRR